jgi:hypothetical protein
MAYDLFDKDGKRKRREGSGVAPRPLDEVEREIVRADMAELIAREKENGDWAKWEESQRPISQLRSLDRDIVHITVTLTIDGQVVTTPPGVEESLMREINQRYAHRLERQEMPSRIMALEHDRRLHQFDPQPPEFDDRGIHNGYIRPSSPRFYTGQITPEIWELFVGRAPVNDDIERANCYQEGMLGHQSCGWCPACMAPHYMCGHGPGMTSTSHGGMGT